MARFGDFRILFALVLAAVSLISVNGQIGTPCTTSMISNFTPCLNFITGSSSNGSSTPTTGCCDTLRSLTSTSMDCACLIVTGNVPFQLPINRTLAITLPRACKMTGVPVQCKASGAPLPAPGPVLLGPTLAPVASAPFAPQASKASHSLVPAPEPATSLGLTPASSPAGAEAPTTMTPTVGGETPTATPGVRPVLNPSVANPSCIASPSVLLFLVATTVFMYS